MNKNISSRYYQLPKKPKALNSINNEIEIQEKLIKDLQQHPNIIFEEEHSDLFSEYLHIQSILNSPEYQGVYSELLVLEELKKLDDRFHVFCDTNISLGKYVSYKGVRNLKSAQMDFIVAGPTGFFIIEAKNWSNSYKYNHYGISPYEQLDRAGLVLWIYLKNHFFFHRPRVTKLLVSIRGNFPYNKSYSSVFVKHYKSLYTYINSRSEIIKDSQLNKVVRSLR